MPDNDQQLDQGKKRPLRKKAKARMSRFMVAFLLGDLFLIVIGCFLLWMFAPTILPALIVPTPTGTPLPTSTLPPTATPLPPTSTPSPTDAPPTPTPSETLTITPSPAPAAGTVMLSDVDGMNLHYVPAGEFMMGNTYEDALDACKKSRSDCELAGLADEAPPHVVTLDAFWIDETEVTNRQYALCVAGSDCQPPVKTRSRTHGLYYGNPQYIDYPVIYISWNDANAYCQWAGRALPSEAQWEEAARGADQRPYPWGDHAPNPSRLNASLGIGDVAKVGNYPSSAGPYGALDMVGNVWEWTADWYIANYYATSPGLNPRGPASGQFRVLRGGAWDGPAVRSSERAANPPTAQNDVTGFRCALPAQ